MSDGDVVFVAGPTFFAASDFDHFDDSVTDGGSVASVPIGFPVLDVAPAAFDIMFGGVSLAPDLESASQEA